LQKKLGTKIYFDNAATTPLEPKVLEAMMPYFTEHFGNPSSIYSLGRDTRAAIETARKTIAQLLNAQTSEIVFTSGGTEANNMAVKGAVIYHHVKRIITSKIEHHSVLYTVEYLEKYHNINIDYVQLMPDGRVDMQHLETLLKDNQEKTLVTLMHANNEIGNLLRIKKVAAMCKEYRALFHSDTVQTFGHFNIDLQQIEADFISGSAHKFHGPKGAGFLYQKKQNKVASFIHGGGQERGYRAGTENVYGIVGLAAAAEMAYAHLEEDSLYIQSIKNYFLEQLNANFIDIQINGDLEHSLYTVLNVSFPDSSAANMLLFNLDIDGICASGGSACSSGALGGSHVINALKPNNDRLNIRFSFSKYNHKTEVDAVIRILKKYIS
jgi:cysteine desulfurase